MSYREPVTERSRETCARTSCLRPPEPGTKRCAEHHHDGCAWRDGRPCVCAQFERQDALREAWG